MTSKIATALRALTTVIPYRNIADGNVGQADSVGWLNIMLFDIDVPKESGTAQARGNNPDFTPLEFPVTNSPKCNYPESR